MRNRKAMKRCLVPWAVLFLQPARMLLRAKGIQACCKAGAIKHIQRGLHEGCSHRQEHPQFPNSTHYKGTGRQQTLWLLKADGRLQGFLFWFLFFLLSLICSAASFLKKKSYTLTKARKEFRLQLSCFSFARSPGSPLSIEVSLCTSTRPPSPTDRCSDFCSALAVISFCFLNTRFPSLPLFARLPSAFSYFAPSTESCIKLFPEDRLNYMHDFLPSTTRRKQRNNHMCLTLLLIYEPMPSLPFCGITAIMPREEWKGLSLQSSESLSGPFLGEKKKQL